MDEIQDNLKEKDRFTESLSNVISFFFHDFHFS